MDFQLTMKTNEEYVDAQAALQPLLGGEPPTLEWMTRMVRRPGEPWKLRVVHAERDLRDPRITSVYCSRDDQESLYLHPWAAPREIMGVIVKEHDLSAETIELLRGPKSPEAEVLRRSRLIRENEERIEAEKAAAIAKQEEQRKVAERERQLDVEFRTAKWDELAPTVQMLTLCALALEDGKTGMDLAAVLRGLAEESHRRGGSLKAPRRVWWTK